MSLARRSVAEGLGTAFLVAAVVGSGIAAQRLSPGDAGLQLLVNSIVTGAALVALILALQPVSAAFNPLVTLLERALGAIDNRVALRLIAAQLAGGLLGVVIANLMFGLPAVTISTAPPERRRALARRSGRDARPDGGHLRRRPHRPRRPDSPTPSAAYITAAYWFTSSTSFANPAVTIARTLSNTFAGIAPASVPAFVAGPSSSARRLAYPLIRLLYPAPARLAEPAIAPWPKDPHDPAQFPRVLFVCVHNAGRSQMAAGYLRHLAGDRIEVRSAGSEPADQINPVAVAAMAEDGIDITAEDPRSSPPTASRRPTSSSPWAAATPVPTSPANATKTGT